MRISLACMTLFYWSIQIGAAQNWQTISVQRIHGTVYTLHFDATTEGLIVGGDFDSIGNNGSLRSVAMWKDYQWHTLGNGLNSYQWPASLRDAVTYNGELYVGGYLTDADGIPCNGIARWDGFSWSSIDNGIDGVVQGLRVMDDELYVCGLFSEASGLSVNGIAKWNGNSWSTVHDFPSFDAEGDVITDCAMYNGELYVAGYFNGGSSNGMLGITRWNNNEWVGVGPIGVGQTTCLAVYSGRLYAAGVFTSAMNPIFPGSHIASWDGNTWDNLGGGLGEPVDDVHQMFVHDDKLYVVGAFLTAGGISAVGIATWDGNEWCDLGSDSDNGMFAIEEFEDTIYIGGGFVELNGVEIISLAKSGGGDYDENCGTLASVDDEGVGVSKLSIYPNPAGETVFIKCSSTIGGINVFNSIGQRVSHLLFHNK